MESLHPSASAHPSPSPHSAASAHVIGAVIGVSRFRIALAPLADGAPVLAESTGAGAPGGATDPDLPEIVTGAVVQLLETAREQGIQPAPHALHVGISGLAATEGTRIRDTITARLAAATSPVLGGMDLSAVSVSDDLLPAFLSAGIGDDGLLLRAGTGAVGLRIQQRRIVARRDGMGPLLGDVGSAVWLGRRTLQAVAADIDDRGRRTLLTERVGDLLDLDLRDGLLPPSPTGDVRDDLARAVRQIAPPERPAALGRFAPLPGTVPEDPAAREILDGVMRHFAQTVRILDQQVELPVVLAGSVLATPGPIHDELVTGFTAAGRDHREVATGVPGSLQLAREAVAGSSRPLR